MTLFSEAMTAARDVRHLGLKALGHRVNRASQSGLKLVNTRFGPYWIRPHETDMNIIRQIYFKNSYDLSHSAHGNRIDDHYQDIIARQKIPVIIDAGANIGVVSRYFCDKYPASRVFAIEPDPKTAELCRLNTAMNAKISVCEAAIGSESGRVIVESFEGHAWATRTRRSAEGLEIITIDDIMKQVISGELFIVKVDIEGFESDLFSKNTDWIDEAYMVIVEPHDWLFPEGGTSQAMQTEMFSKGRDLIVSGENLIWIKREINTNTLC